MSMLWLVLNFSWTPQVIKTWSNYGADVEVGDLNGDGLPDIVASQDDDVGGSSASIFWNNGARSFSEQSLLSGTGWGLAVGDFDGDGDLDIAYTGRNQVGWLENPSWTDHAFESGYDCYSIEIESGDLDGDGDLDLVQAREDMPSAGQVMAYENDGSGNFTAHPIASHYRADGIGIADYDRDGDKDVVILSGVPGDGYGIVAYEMADWSSWTAHVISTNANDFDDWRIGAGDLNGDGLPDFVTPWPRVYVNGGGFSFTAQDLDSWGHTSDYRFLGGASAVDIDKDGDLDVLVQAGSFDMSTPRVVVFWNQGGSFTQEVVSNSYAPYWSGIKAADLDLDGCVDIVANTSSNLVVFWFEDCPTKVSEEPGRPEPTLKRGILSLPEPSLVRVYDASGRLRWAKRLEAGEHKLPLGKGVWLVRLGGRTFKAVVQ